MLFSSQHLAGYLLGVSGNATTNILDFFAPEKQNSVWFCEMRMGIAKAVGLKLLLIGRNSCVGRLLSRPRGVMERAVHFLCRTSLPPTGRTPKMHISKGLFLGIRYSYFYEFSFKKL